MHIGVDTMDAYLAQLETEYLALLEKCRKLEEEVESLKADNAELQAISNCVGYSNTITIS